MDINIYKKIRSAFNLSENCRELPVKSTKGGNDKFTGDKGPHTPNKAIKGEKVDVADEFTNEKEKNSQLYPKKFESKTKP